jgi:signal transduction histidine kinase
VSTLRDRSPPRPDRQGTSLSTKLFASFLVVSLLPIAVMTALSERHLDRIQEVSAHETREALEASEVGRLRERLSQEADRLAGFFARVQGEARTLRSFAEAIAEHPERFTYRNGSRYGAGAQGGYGNRGDDGNSALSAPRYTPEMKPWISATESLDLAMRPLATREPRLALAWFISARGFARAFPWRDFRTMPRGREYTTWPFYYLADPRRNPSRREVFTDVYVDPLSGERMISCLAPVYVRGRHVGTVGIDITLQNLLQEIREIRVSRHSGSLLTDGSAIIAASEGHTAERLGLEPGSGPGPRDLADSRIDSARGLARLLRGGTAGVEVLDLDGARVFAGYAPVDPPGWRIALLVPEEDVVGPARESAANVLAETRKIRTNFVHILLFSVLGLTGIAWFVFVYQSRGLRRLLAGIRTLGGGELSLRLAEGPGEFGRLAGALNTMAQGLQEKERELRRVSLEMEQGRKLAAVGTLAAGIAHEVNNPLATISTYAQMLHRRGDVPPDAAHDLEVVLGEIRRIQAKLRNLLDLSRLPSPVRTELDPNALVEEVVGLVRHEAEARGIEVSVDPAAGLPAFRLDRSGMKQVLWNLLGNAIDAQEGGGSIAVRTRQDGGALVLEVEDLGPGVPEPLLSRIFEPFFTTKEVGQGTGLGLALAYSVVKSHEGRIEVENLAGGGCVFRVVIPEGGRP